MSGSILTLSGFDPTSLEWIIERGCMHLRHEVQPTLHGSIVATFFESTSTRTRTAFTAGALRRGASVIAYGPGDLQTNTGETVADTGRVIGSMVDAVVVRSPKSDTVARDLAIGVGSVVNAMSAAEHPTQAISDLTWLADRYGGVRGLRGRSMLYVGEGNNTATALCHGAALLGLCLDLRTPAGYAVPPDVMDAAKRVAATTAATVTESHDLVGIDPLVDVVYTTRWQTTGTSKPDPNWRSDFAPFVVDEQLLSGMPDAIVMHDLPAHRGEEITAAVLDGPRCVAFSQAACKMASAQAVLEWCLLSDSSLPSAGVAIAG